MIAIDAVRDCRGDHCPVYDKCPYAKSGKCTVERGYLEAVQNSMFDMIKKDMTQELLNGITLRLIPLFHQLVRFQIFAYSVEEVCYTTTRGLLKMHPVFREIRDTIKAIELTQRSLGLEGEYIRALGVLKEPGVLPRDRPDEEVPIGPDWREKWNEKYFDQNLGLRDAEDKPKLRRAK
jgi:hypothetical protein